MWLSAFWLALPFRQFSLVLWFLDRWHLALFFCQQMVLKFIGQKLESKSHPLPFDEALAASLFPSVTWQSSLYFGEVALGSTSPNGTILRTPWHLQATFSVLFLNSIALFIQKPAHLTVTILCPTKAPSSSNSYTWSLIFLKYYQSLCQRSIPAMVSKIK